MAEDTYTTRLNLIKTDPNNPIDVDKLNTDFQRIDDGYGGCPWFSTTAQRDAAYALQPFDFCRVGATRDTATLYIKQPSSASGLWTALTEDPAWKVLGAGNLTPAANFTITSAKGLRRAGMVYLNILGTYTGPQINASSTGNIADTTLLTVATDWRPPGNSTSLHLLSGYVASDPFAWFLGWINPNNGALIMANLLNSNQYIATNSTITLTTSYPLAY